MMISCILPKNLSVEKALVEPKDLHKNGELSNTSTPETGDEAASRDDQHPVTIKERKIKKPHQ
jgi:hypothetical protein